MEAARKPSNRNREGYIVDEADWSVGLDSNGMKLDSIIEVRWSHQRGICIAALRA